MTSGIYAIVNSTNGKRYIGSAINIERRTGRHRSELLHGRHPNQKLQRAYDKYGRDSFTIEVLEEVENYHDLIPREQHWIDTLQPEYNIRADAASNRGWTPDATTLERRSAGMKRAWQDPDKRQNMMRFVQSGADAVRDKPLSEEHKAKVSQRTKEALARPETRANLVRAMTGKPKSASHRAALGVAAKKRWESAEYRQKFHDARANPEPEKKRSAEVRQRISEGKKGKARPDLAQRNTDPAHLAKVRAGIAAYWEKKRAERDQDSAPTA